MIWNEDLARRVIYGNAFFGKVRKPLVFIRHGEPRAEQEIVGPFWSRSEAKEMHWRHPYNPRLVRLTWRSKHARTL